jgi:hypothetical protein
MAQVSGFYCFLEHYNCLKRKAFEMLNIVRDRFCAFAAGSYELGARICTKLYRLFWGARFSAMVCRRFSKAPAQLAIELFVSLSLCVYLYFLISVQASAPRRTDGNETNLFLFTCRSSAPYYPHEDLMETFNNWKARLVAPLLSGWVDDRAFDISYSLFRHGYLQSSFVSFKGYSFPVQSLAFGFYHCFWVFLLFVALALSRKDALLLILGVFGGLMYNLTIPAGQWFYPWDMPSLFFFTLACLAYDSRRLVLLMAVVCLGGLFKETNLCCALLILLAEHWPLKKRIIAFGVAMAVYMVLRKVLIAFCGVDTMLFALNNSHSLPDMLRKTWSVLSSNTNELFSAHLNNFVFVNAGGLLIVMLFPWRTRREVVLKTLMICFVIGQFLCGIIVEFRVWYELLPLGWILLSERLHRGFGMERPTSAPKTAPSAPATAAPDCSGDRVMVGSYWLLMIVLLTLAAGIFWVSHFTPRSAAVIPSGAVNTSDNAAPAHISKNQRLMQLVDESSALEQAGQCAEAIKHYKAAIELEPSHPIPWNNLAVIYASCPQPQFRDNAQALVYATRAVKLSGHRDPLCLGTLALVLAQNGRLSEATATATEAREIARFQQNKDLMDHCEELLKLLARGETPL